ncbi:hypothetical protein SESBI_15466 [Sesbania bispinosa]|nr:hypothetical protein SESBI_15466 [Sesbania bispinosa]
MAWNANEQSSSSWPRTMVWMRRPSFSDEKQTVRANMSQRKEATAPLRSAMVDGKG